MKQIVCQSTPAVTISCSLVLSLSFGSMFSPAPYHHHLLFTHWTVFPNIAHLAFHQAKHRNPSLLQEYVTCNSVPSPSIFLLFPKFSCQHPLLWNHSKPLNDPYYKDSLGHTVSVAYYLSNLTPVTGVESQGRSSLEHNPSALPQAPQSHPQAPSGLQSHTMQPLPLLTQAAPWPAHLFVGIQEKALPDAAHPLWGQHAPPLPASGLGAAQEQHHVLEENDRVIERQEEAVGEENWQNLQCDQQVYAEDAHLPCLPSQFPCALWLPFTLLLKRGWQ